MSTRMIHGGNSLGEQRYWDRGSAATAFAGGRFAQSGADEISPWWKDPFGAGAGEGDLSPWWQEITGQDPNAMFEEGGSGGMPSHENLLLIKGGYDAGVQTGLKKAGRTKNLVIGALLGIAGYWLFQRVV